MEDFCTSFCDISIKCAEESDETQADYDECKTNCPKQIGNMSGIVKPSFLTEMIACGQNTSCDELPVDDEESDRKMDLSEYCIPQLSCVKNASSDMDSGVIGSISDMLKRCTSESRAQLYMEAIQQSDSGDPLTAVMNCLSDDTIAEIDTCFSEYTCPEEGALDMEDAMQTCLLDVMNVLAPGEASSEVERAPPGDALPEPSDEDDGTDSSDN